MINNKTWLFEPFIYPSYSRHLPHFGITIDRMVVVINSRCWWLVSQDATTLLFCDLLIYLLLREWFELFHLILHNLWPESPQPTLCRMIYVHINAFSMLEPLFNIIKGVINLIYSSGIVKSVFRTYYFAIMPLITFNGVQWVFWYGKYNERMTMRMNLSVTWVCSLM